MTSCSAVEFSRHRKSSRSLEERALLSGNQVFLLEILIGFGPGAGLGRAAGREALFASLLLAVFDGVAGLL